jgi:glycosyltransferase involved in cell wall biosynthesis
MIILSHPTGNENVRQAGLAFADANLLERFFTTINWNSHSVFDRFLPAPVRETLRRRSFPQMVQKRTTSLPLRETARLLFGALHLPFFSEHERGFLSIDAVSAALDRAVAAAVRKSTRCKLVYGYEDCALASFRAAEGRGIPCVYDLPIGYWRVAQRIFAEECQREPEWAPTLMGARDSKEKLARKDEELRLATRALVASTFTKSTLTEATQRQSGLDRSVTVIHYGAPIPATNEIETTGGKLKILFVGALGQRKGLSYALRAVELIGGKNCELTLLGRKVAEGCPPLDQAVRTHRWLPSVPHVQVLREMRQHDVLIFPSLFEGFGLAITEAMSQGIPVITTAHTAGPDIIDDRVDGFIVPIRSAEAIAEKLEVLASDREGLRAMKIAAREKAKKHLWQNYRHALLTFALEIMNVRQDR